MFGIRKRIKMTELNENPKFVSNMNGIRFYGGNSNLDGEYVPEAPATLTKLFDVPVEMYMTVGTEFLNDIIRLVKSLGYVYKVKTQTKYTVVALQYQKPQ